MTADWKAPGRGGWVGLYRIRPLTADSSLEYRPFDVARVEREEVPAGRMRRVTVSGNSCVTFLEDGSALGEHRHVRIGPVPPELAHLVERRERIEELERLRPLLEAARPDQLRLVQAFLQHPRTEEPSQDPVGLQLVRNAIQHCERHRKLYEARYGQTYRASRSPELTEQERARARADHRRFGDLLHELGSIQFVLGGEVAAFERELARRAEEEKS